MTLIASDGYEYENLTQRLLGNPKSCARNGNFKAYTNFRGRSAGRDYIRGFDSICPDGDPGPSAGFARAHTAGLDAMHNSDVAAFGELIDHAIFTTLSRPVHATS